MEEPDSEQKTTADPVSLPILLVVGPKLYL